MMNVCGLVNTAQEIEDWILDDRINILALSEILLTPGIHPNLSLENETVSGPLNAHGLTTKGGVAIVLYGIAKYKVAKQLAYKSKARPMSLCTSPQQHDEAKSSIS